MFAFPGISWNFLISRKLPRKDQDFSEFRKFPSKFMACIYYYPLKTRPDYSQAWYQFYEKCMLHQVENIIRLKNKSFARSCKKNKCPF